MTVAVSHPKAVLSRVLVSLALLGVGGVAFRVSLKPLPPVVIDTHALSDDLRGVKAARVTLETRIGRVSVRAGRTKSLSGEASLEGALQKASSTVDGVRTLKFTQVVDAARTRRLFNANPDRQRFDVNLPPTLPIDLDVRGGFGETSIDLRGSHVRSVNVRRGGEYLDVTLPARAVTAKIDATFGETYVSGPASSGSLDVRGDVGRISLDLTTARETDVRAETKFGELEASLPPTFDAVLSTETGEIQVDVPALSASSSLNVRSKFGDVTLNVPKGVNIRLEARSKFGDVEVPSGFEDNGAAFVRRGSGPLLIVRAQSSQGDVIVREVEP